jgi:hypothetical protein
MRGQGEWQPKKMTGSGCWGGVDDVAVEGLNDLVEEFVT